MWLWSEQETMKDALRSAYLLMVGREYCDDWMSVKLDPLPMAFTSFSTSLTTRGPAPAAAQQLCN